MTNDGMSATRQEQTSATALVYPRALSTEAVLDALKLILIGAPLNDVLTSIALLIEAHTPGALCSVFLLDQDGVHLRYAAAPTLSDEYRIATDGVSIGPEVGSCGAAAYLRQPVFVSDVLSHPHFASFRDLILQTGMRASWSSPIISHDGKVLGTFGMFYREVREPGPAEIQLIDDASQIAGIAIERDRSQEALKSAFEEIRNSEVRLLKIIDTIPTLAWCSLPDGTGIFWNRRWHEYTGLPLEVVRGWGWQDAIHPEDLKEITDKWLGFLSTGQPGEVEGRLRRFDGVYRWFLFRAEPLRDESGNIVNWYGTDTDIEDLKRAQAKLRQDEEELRRMTDAIPQSIIVLNPDGKVIYANRVALEYTGLSLDDAQADGFRARVFHPDDVQRLREERQEGLSRTAPFENEQRALGKDGKYRWFLIRYNPLLDETENVIRWYATGTDIDDRKRNEDRTRNENVALREEIERSSMHEEIVGSSQALRSVISQVGKVAPTDSTVLIFGETGTGKELIARAIHDGSKRSSRAFIRVNCGAIPSSLIASELFGHEKGSFTGALQRRTGRFESADGGTIFLDEVSELPIDTQVALLRVLQEREFERVGGSQTISVDVRVLAATNRNLNVAVREGSFREDLFYRLNVFPIRMPALRERMDDIPILAEYLIDRYAKRLGKKITKINKKTMSLLQAYHWPGNVRELQNVIERAVILSDGETFFVDETWFAPVLSKSGVPTASMFANLIEQEKELIENALREACGRVAGPTGAAAKLGIPRQTLESKIRKLGIDRYRFKAS
jgi:formate hydrogenlyase transcriptional activator